MGELLGVRGGDTERILDFHFPGASEHPSDRFLPRGGDFPGEIRGIDAVHPGGLDPTGGVGYTYGITGPIRIPDEESEFQAFIGIADGGNPSDGVVFQVVAIDEKGVEHELLKEHRAKREWKPVSAGLSAFKGQSIRLKFITDVGPNDDSSADWAAWGEPRIALKKPEMRISVGK